MHELSIALSILELAEEEADRRGNVRVLGIHLKLGPLAGVVKEALLSAFELAREGSPLDEVQLVIQEVPVLAYCPVCRVERAVASLNQLICIECRTPTPQVTSGRELEVVALELQ
jgi:hydrogenase nickel incorporation protein HypA/HybF